MRGVRVQKVLEAAEERGPECDGRRARDALQIHFQMHVPLTKSDKSPESEEVRPVRAEDHHPFILIQRTT